MSSTTKEPDFSVPQNGANIPWNQTMTDGRGNPIDITGATSVKLRWGPKNGTVPSVVGTGGLFGVGPVQAQYVFTSGDLSTHPPGNYSAQFEVTLAGGEQIVWPVDRPPDDPYALLEIVPQVP